MKFVKEYMDSKYLDKFGWEVSFQDERTWNYLHKVYTDDAQKYITLIMGQDEYDDLKAGKWHQSDDILNTYNIKVIPRTDGVSSSKVRELIKNKQFDEVKKYVSDKTFDFLKAEGYMK
jgi:nicotinic acid mononucleotide adenylyltransferase